MQRRTKRLVKCSSKTDATGTETGVAGKPQLSSESMDANVRDFELFKSVRDLQAKMEGLFDDPQALSKEIHGVTLGLIGFAVKMGNANLSLSMDNITDKNGKGVGSWEVLVRRRRIK